MEPTAVRRVALDDEWADWPLARLGVPPLDVLEVRGEQAVRWYELTGDLATLPEALR